MVRSNTTMQFSLLSLRQAKGIIRCFRSNTVPYVLDELDAFRNGQFHVFSGDGRSMHGSIIKAKNLTRVIRSKVKPA